MAEYGYGMPMEIGSPSRLWKGGIKTNGFLMKAVNGRIPSLVEGYARIVVDAANPLYALDVVPWGNALWRDVGEIDMRPGVRHAQAPLGKPLLVGVFEFNQGWQASNPIQPYGMPSYSTGSIVRKGLVGYEHALAGVDKAEDYVRYIKGESGADVDTNTVRTLYSDWIAAWKNAAAGSQLGLFFDNATGFPVVSVVLAANLAAPVLAGCAFGGFAEVVAKEFERVYFDIQL
jgi:hypothetical protein